MKTPQVNEVWKLKSGRLGLIVSSDRMGSAILWYDEIDKEWCVGPVLARLQKKTELSPSGFFTIAQEWSNPLILGQWTPEEYAASWGCEPRYDKPPSKPGDGTLFYNFSSEKQVRDKPFLTQFIAAINRQLLANPEKIDREGLIQLKNHVQNILDSI